MDLYYDNIVYGLQKVGGISSYWYELSKRYQRDPQVKIRFVETGTEHPNILRQLLKIDPQDVFLNKKYRLYLERFRRVKINSPDQPSVFHSSYFRVPVQSRKLRVVTTVHDFTHERYFKGPRLWLHNLAKKRAILESDAIITVSDHTRKDLLEYYPGIDPLLVQVIYHGVAEEFCVLPGKKEHDKRTFLYVGSRDGYKNFEFAVDVIKGLNDAHLNVVGRSFSREELRMLDLKIPGRYTLYSDVSTRDLNTLYNESFCLLYPSSYEGFGIPLLEAMRAGCPFIALNACSIPEVAGHAGYLLSKLDLEEAWHAVDRIGADRAQFVQAGLEQSRNFSWDKCYAETTRLYNNLIGSI
jgi:mannosyltransferase